LKEGGKYVVFILASWKKPSIPTITALHGTMRQVKWKAVLQFSLNNAILNWAVGWRQGKQCPLFPPINIDTGVCNIGP
jgi:hypothetical protein